MLTDLLNKLNWPLKKLSDEVKQEVAEKAAIGARAALAEAPLLDALLDGEPVEIVIQPFTIQLKKKVK